MATELSRIYQGRATKAEIKDEKGQWHDTGDSCSNILFQHHMLFQDAVNYYLLALAAMAADPQSIAGKMKQRICDSAWNDFSKNGENRSGMHRSIERSLSIPAGGLQGPEGFKKALNRVLDGNPVDPEKLQLALELIQSRCKGDIQKSGSTYIARLTSKGYNARFVISMAISTKMLPVGLKILPRLPDQDHCVHAALTLRKDNFQESRSIQFRRMNSFDGCRRRNSSLMCRRQRK